jgi:hypothetical protein
MSQESIHPTEELAPFARGDLGAPEAERVRQHIAGCRDCAAELAAISALAGSPEPPALNDLERRGLHRGVFEELQVTGSPARRGVGARIAPALGAAALLAVLVFGGAQVLQGGLSGGDDAESSAGVAADSGGAGGEGPLGLPASERTALSAQDGASSGAGYDWETRRTVAPRRRPRKAETPGERCSTSAESPTSSPGAGPSPAMPSGTSGARGTPSTPSAPFSRSVKSVSAIHWRVHWQLPRSNRASCAGAYASFTGRRIRGHSPRTARSVISKGATFSSWASRPAHRPGPTSTTSGSGPSATAPRL